MFECRMGARLVTGFLGVAILPSMRAQSQPEEVAMVRTSTPEELPDAPQPMPRPNAFLLGRGESLSQAQPDPAAMVPAKRLAMTIQPNQTASTWTARDKFEAAFRKEASIGGLSSMVFSGAWGTWRDLRPHYGTDAEAFGQRVGAAAIRQTSQSFFNVGLYSSLLHDDPRYYVKGPAYPFKQRVVYAASRVLITRKDSGGNTFNLPLIAGVMSSSALTNAYYPDEDDHSAGRTILSGVFSLTYRIATQELKEFGGDIRQRLHMKH